MEVKFRLVGIDGYFPEYDSLASYIQYTQVAGRRFLGVPDHDRTGCWVRKK
jgi:hypothetical protein